VTIKRVMCRVNALSILLSSLAVLLITVSTCLGCVCAGEQTIDAAYAEASSVFTGRFLGSEYRKGIRNQIREMQRSGGEDIGEYEVLVYRFEVKATHKGAPAREIFIATDHTRAKDGSETISDCELVFAKGREYLVYAALSDGHLYSGACTRTALSSRAKKDLKRIKSLRQKNRTLI
jgi:hypothetical protein